MEIMSRLWTERAFWRRKIVEDHQKTKVKVNKADFYDPPLKLILAFSPLKVMSEMNGS